MCYVSGAEGELQPFNLGKKRLHMLVCVGVYVCNHIHKWQGNVSTNFSELTKSQNFIASVVKKSSAWSA